MFSFFYLPLLLASTYCETFKVDVFEDVEVELSFGTLANQVGSFSQFTDFTVTSVVGEPLPDFPEGNVFNFEFDFVQFFFVQGLKPGQNSNISFAFTDINSGALQNFNIIFRGVDLVVNEETFIITECNCQDEVFPNLAGEIISNISTGENNFECASETHGILPIATDENEIEFFFPSEFFKSSFDPDIDSSWVGMIQFEALNDISSLVIDDFIEFEVAGSENLLFGIDLGVGSLTNQGIKRRFGSSPAPIDNKPVLIFGNLPVAAFGGLENLESFAVFSTVFTDLIFDLPFPRLTDTVDFSSAGNLTGNVKIKVQQNFIFQSLKFFKVGVENTRFVRISPSILSLELIKITPEIRGRLLPTIAENFKMILSEEILPLDVNPKVFFSADEDDLDFRNASVGDLILEDDNFLVAKIDPVENETLSFDFGDNFVSCFSEAFVPLEFAELEPEFSRFSLDLEQNTFAQFELNLSSLSKTIFVSMPDDEFTLLLGDCASQDVIESGRKIELGEEDSVLDFCVSIEVNQSVSNNFIIYSAKNNTVSDYFIIDVDFEFAEDEIEQVDEPNEYDELLLMIIASTTTFLVVIATSICAMNYTTNYFRV